MSTLKESKTTGDAGDREPSSRFPGRDLLHVRRARQYVEGTKIQERYLCGPRHEAQLTGRAESGFEECRPGWMSREHGVETLLRFFRTPCAKLALPDVESHGQASFHTLKRKKHELLVSWCARNRNECTRVRRALARLQRAETADDTERQRPHNSTPPEDHNSDWQEWNSEVLHWDGHSEGGASAWPW